MEKQIRKQEIVVCQCCKKSFLKDSSEVKRNTKLNRKIFCSLSCVSVYNNLHNIKNRYNNTKHLNPGNRTDEFTGFREHLKRIKYRTKEVDLTLQDLKDIFDSQNGVCAYSKVKLEKVPRSGKSNPIYTMSLDRIDSKIGYIKNNIQFISIAMNHLKNAMTHQQMLEMLEILKN